jgi:ADP-ribose pyrophosphatase YjhB (NUDIX family)
MNTTCGIFLINKNIDILLVHPNNAPWHMWSIPKGLVNKGESYIDAAFRELFEETNIKLNIKSSKIKRKMEFELMPYNKTKKQLKAYVLFVDEDFSDVSLKCTSTFENRDGIKIPENDKVQWFPLNFQSIEKYSHITLHNTQEKILKELTTNFFM